MNPQQYRLFLDNPVLFLNGPGNVRQIRLDGTMTQAMPNSVSRTVQYPGAVPLHYQYSAARVTPVTLRYDDTGISATSAVWISRNQPGGQYQRDRAYYLQWAADHAYAIELAFDAQLFFTAELTGCGIMVFTAPNKTIVVHHNVQVPPVPLTFMQQMFESAAARQQRETAHVSDVRTQTLHGLAQDIAAAHPDITGGTLLSVQQYGATARVFGIKRNGQWRLYVNRPVGGTYQTELLSE
ncbi:hypothetical protein [Trinickia dinghuensis]|uniref:Uncharacterized protein n=1 Tax=Trinickia dinghuensis TaxID=2291023 RepID=A0A3D8JU83_9BURK|nr:hypothetical protein [Trinickia dinghuensis]RDU96659.1 hypothetical protein DWV00_21885 [Trinickia dinghuensis]